MEPAQRERGHAVAVAGRRHASAAKAQAASDIGGGDSDRRVKRPELAPCEVEDDSGADGGNGRLPRLVPPAFVGRPLVRLLCGRGRCCV
jgi:hypothetical protein